MKVLEKFPFRGNQCCAGQSPHNRHVVSMPSAAGCIEPSPCHCFVASDQDILSRSIEKGSLRPTKKQAVQEVSVSFTRNLHPWHLRECISAQFSSTVQFRRSEKLLQRASGQTKWATPSHFKEELIISAMVQQDLRSDIASAGAARRPYPFKNRFLTLHIVVSIWATKKKTAYTFRSFWKLAAFQNWTLERWVSPKSLAPYWPGNFRFFRSESKSFGACRTQDSFSHAYRPV